MLFSEVVIALVADRGILAEAHLVLMRLVASDVAPDRVDNDFVLRGLVVANL